MAWKCYYRHTAVQCLPLRTLAGPCKRRTLKIPNILDIWFQSCPTNYIYEYVAYENKKIRSTDSDTHHTKRLTIIFMCPFLAIWLEIILPNETIYDLHTYRDRDERTKRPQRYLRQNRIAIIHRQHIMQFMHICPKLPQNIIPLNRNEPTSTCSIPTIPQSEGTHTI